MKKELKKRWQSCVYSVLQAVSAVAQWSSRHAYQVLLNQRKQRIESQTTSTLLAIAVSSVLWLFPFILLVALAKLSASLDERIRGYYDKIVNNL